MSAPGSSDPAGTPWLLIAAVSAVLATMVKLPASRAPTPPAPRAERPRGWEAAVRMRVPLCGQSLQQMAGGGSPSLRPLGAGHQRLEWGGAGELAFEYDESKRQLKPLTPRARKLLDIRSPCPK